MEWIVRGRPPHFRPGLGGVTAGEQVAVPAQHRGRPHQQSHPAQQPVPDAPLGTA